MNTDQSTLDACLAIVAAHITELEMIKRPPGQRNSSYDRQTGLRLDYAIRWCKRIAEAMRNLPDTPLAEVFPDAQNGLPGEVKNLLQELRPSIAQSRDSVWKKKALARIDAIMNLKE
jgi:hypothetical protein